ncbi:hypothetical protein JOM56_009747 [Amanita muscaria]
MEQWERHSRKRRAIVIIISLRTKVSSKQSTYSLFNTNSICTTGASSLDEDGLLFQSLMTIMKFYNRFYNHQRMPGVPDCVGTVIATVIRRTQIKGHNASFCFQVLNQFKLMLEGVYQRVGDFSSQNPNANLRFAVQLLHRLDLRTIKKWEIDIQQITGNHVPLLDEMVSFMEKLDPGQEGEVVEVKGQLDAFHKGRPWRYERAF